MKAGGGWASSAKLIVPSTGKVCQSVPICSPGYPPVITVLPAHSNLVIKFPPLTDSKGKKGEGKADRRVGGVKRLTHKSCMTAPCARLLCDVGVAFPWKCQFSFLFRHHVTQGETGEGGSAGKPVSLHHTFRSYPALAALPGQPFELRRAVICTTTADQHICSRPHKALYWPMFVPCWSLYATTRCSPMLNCLININVINKFRAARKQRRLKRRKSTGAHSLVSARSREVGPTHEGVQVCFLMNRRIFSTKSESEKEPNWHRRITSRYRVTLLLNRGEWKGGGNLIRLELNEKKQNVPTYLKHTWHTSIIQQSDSLVER